LKEIVRETSKADAILTYGPGTRRVRIELAFPDDDDFVDGMGSSHANLEPTVFVIEMAPIDLMPHSVYTFLEMASAGLLDGCSFILNAIHVLKAAPLPYDGTPPSVKAQEFLDKGLESVAFREYSADYPHKQYTVGFAADGSPSFYINTEDNSEIHAGYPCFAKVVSGFETIHRLEQSPTRNGLWLEQRVGIKKVTVL
jgi:cyclophilin family peptidyl-prolyl cis-trans isomerase